MDNKPIRVAQIIGRTINGGVENLIMNYYFNIDKNKVQFDFFVESTSRIIDEKVINSLGGKVFIIPKCSKVIKYQKKLVSIFKHEKYDIVQANINSLSVFPLRAAKKANIKIRICNSLSMSNKNEKIRDFLKNILRKKSTKYATHLFACSDLCGSWLYGKETLKQQNYFKINNAIETDNYQFNELYRKDLIDKFNLQDKFIIGTIGRLEKQKNQLFLIDIFNEIQKKVNNAFLIIIGDGDLKPDLETRLKLLGIDKKAMILTSKEVGVRGSALKFYSLFDVFVLPSLYEGLPTVGIEAQICSLPCFFSNNITEETAITDNAIFISLDNSPIEWADQIIERKNLIIRKKVFCNEYDVKFQAKHLENLYKRFMEDIK